MTHVPFSLLPSPIPSQTLNEAFRIQPLMNEFIFKLATNRTWLY